MRISALASKPPQASTTAGRPELAELGAVPVAHARDPDAVVHEAGRARAVADLDAGALRDLGVARDQPRAAAPALDREPAPEPEPAVHLERLAAVHRDEAHALRPEPLHGVEAAAHQDVDQIGVGPVLGHARHVVEELVLGVGAEVGGRDLLGR